MRQDGAALTGDSPVKRQPANPEVQCLATRKVAGVEPHPHVIHEGTVTSVDIHGREDVQKLRAGSIGLVSVLFLCITGSAP
jgi:hypothetical protein